MRTFWPTHGWSTGLDHLYIEDYTGRSGEAGYVYAIFCNGERSPCGFGEDQLMIMADRNGWREIDLPPEAARRPRNNARSPLRKGYC